MNSENDCLKCGGTGITAMGEVCDCRVKMKFVLPTSVSVPVQYQNIKFDKSFLKKPLQENYGCYMEKLLNECVERAHVFNRNVLICAPPNSGKTVWAYSVFGTLYAKGVKMPELMDLIEARSVLLDYHFDDKDRNVCLSNARLAIIKIPWDLPLKFPETMVTIVNRRVRNGCSTIFIYDGTVKDLEAQDRFSKLKQVWGDGSYNTIEVKSFDVEGKCYGA